MSRNAQEAFVTQPVSPLTIGKGRQGSGLKSGLKINYLMLAVFFLLSLMVRWWMLDKRWINPDEGAHLMDALLTLQGFVPQIDFGARQTFYVLVNAVWLKLLGVSYLYGRLLPMTCSLLTGIMVFLIARRLFNEQVALLAALIYLMLPLEVLNSVVVKTEPLANLLACSSFYLLLLYSGGRNRFLLLLSGLVAALGYYVRQSLLVLAVLGFVFIVTERDRNVRETARSLGWYALGYGLIVLSYLGFYMKFTSISDLLYSSANPVGFVLRAVKKIWDLFFIEIGSGMQAVGDENIRLGTKTAHSFYYLRSTFFLHLSLFWGILWAALRLVLRGDANPRFNPQYRRSYFLLLSWAALLTSAYIYRYKTFGYYIDYFREFLPVLTIILAAYVWETIFQKSQGKALIYSLILVAVGISALFLIERYGIDLSKGIQVVVSIGAVAVIMAGREKMGRSSKKLNLVCVAALASFYFLCRGIDLIPRNLALMLSVGGMLGITTWFISNRLRFLNISLTLSLLVLSTTFAASTMDMRYDSVWSNEAVQKVAASIKENSDMTDEVMSGAVIWELESHRRPVAMISHPLTYRYYMPKKVASRVEKALREGQPHIIVLDGYTEKIYLSNLTWMQDVLDNRYELILENEEAKYPLRVFKLKN